MIEWKANSFTTKAERKVGKTLTLTRKQLLLGQLLERIVKTQYEAIPVIAMVTHRRYEDEKANKSAKTTMPTTSSVKATKFSPL